MTNRSAWKPGVTGDHPGRAEAGASAPLVPIPQLARGHRMSELATVDRVEVLVLVDNVTDNLSTSPAYVENEWARLWKKGLRRLAGHCLCCGAHGLSCAITARRGDTARTLLFDTGPDAWVFERNVERLGFDIGSVDGIVLSHGHWDHCGAMLRALEMIQLSNGGRAVPTYMHPEVHRSRAMKAPVPETVDAMRAFDLKTIAAAHCTGWRAVSALAAAFGPAVVPSAVGKTYRY
jgi:metal-dependent hydrolase (beta-lactamase superfamily II)